MYVLEFQRTSDQRQDHQIKDKITDLWVHLVWARVVNKNADRQVLGHYSMTMSAVSLEAPLMWARVVNKNADRQQTGGANQQRGVNLFKGEALSAFYE